MKDQSKNNFYVYRLRNPLTGVIFYIGYGKGKRVSEHWKLFLKQGMRSCRGNNFKYRVLCELLEAGTPPIEEIITKQNLSENIAQKLESKLILSIGRLCNGSGSLVNIKVEQWCPMRVPEIAKKVGPSLRKFYKTEEGKKLAKASSERAKLQCQGVNNPNYGNKWPEWKKKKLRAIKKIQNAGANNPNYGNKWTVRQRQTLSQKLIGTNIGKNNPNYGNKWSEKQKNNLSLKKSKNILAINILTNNKTLGINCMDLSKKVNVSYSIIVKFSRDNKKIKPFKIWNKKFIFVYEENFACKKSA